MPAAFPTLLSPIQVGAHSLRNRGLMGSMHTRLEHMDRAVERLAMFYAERARGGAGLIVTGGYAPNIDARIDETGPVLITPEQADELKPIPHAVHAHGGKIILQVLHPGRYAKIEQPVGASLIPSRINPRVPRALATHEVWQTVEDYVRCAELALARRLRRGPARKSGTSTSSSARGARGCAARSRPGSGVGSRHCRRIHRRGHSCAAR